MKTKEEFLKKLETALRDFPKETKEEILSDYKEHIEVAIEEGKVETEIISNLDSPEKIAKEARLEGLVKTAEKNKSIGNFTRVIFASLGLSFFNIVFVLGPVLGLLGILIGLYAIALSLFASGIFVLGFVLVEPFIDSVYFQFNFITNLFASITLITGGVTFGIIDWYLTKFFYKAVISFIKLNISIIKQ